MASLDVDSEQIVPQDIVDRYHDWVTNHANSEIAWGDNAYPFGEFTQTGIFGGSTGGIGATVNGTNLGSAGNNITANPIYSNLLEHTRKYLKIRKIRAVLNVTGDGGNTGSRPTPGVIFDETKKAHLNNDYQTNLESRFPTGAVPRDGINAGENVSAYWLEIFFSRLRERYDRARDEDIPSFQTDVCHASCHSSCHGSRGRR
jgi:hypothetical protein